jgi:hypothetical protein
MNQKYLAMKGVRPDNRSIYVWDSPLGQTYTIGQTTRAPHPNLPLFIATADNFARNNDNQLFLGYPYSKVLLIEVNEKDVRWGRPRRASLCQGALSDKPIPWFAKNVEVDFDFVSAMAVKPLEELTTKTFNVREAFIDAGARYNLPLLTYQIAQQKKLELV